MRGWSESGHVFKAEGVVLILYRVCSDARRAAVGAESRNAVWIGIEYRGGVVI